MPQDAAPPFRYGRAVVAFLVSYIGVTPLALGLYFIIAASMGIDLSAEFNIREDNAYALAERLYPILNLLVWTPCAWIYFRGRTALHYKEALKLGGFWLAIAVPLDLLAFVLIENPLSVSAEGFYIEQFPWIYLTYAAVFAAPLCFVELAKRFRQ